MLSQVFVRTVMSAISSLQLVRNDVPARPFDYFLWGFRKCWIGWFPTGKYREQSDMHVPAITGLLELLFYPLLLAANGLTVDGTTVIGAWIAFKAVAQANRWKDDRFSFHRFLLGNAMVVIFSVGISIFTVKAS